MKLISVAQSNFHDTFTFEMENKTTQRAWAMYDWANSTYNLVVSTAIFPIFYTALTIGNEDGAEGDWVMFFGMHLKNTEALSYAFGFRNGGGVLAYTTARGHSRLLWPKEIFYAVILLSGSAACASLYFFDVQNLEISMISIVVACIGFWCSYAFYNAFLPEVASPEEQDALSARGFSLGYIGSVILLLINLIMIKGFDISARWCFVTVGLWWAGFGQYTFYHLKENQKQGNRAHMLTHGFSELKKVWAQSSHMPALRNYLIAFFVFSMGVQTIMQMASLFGTKEIERIDEMGNVVMGLEAGQLIAAIFLVQLIAIPGAMLFAKFSRRHGNLNTLKLALLTWIAVCLYAYFGVHTPVDFFIAAGCIGFIMGGTQSLARSSYSKLLPDKDHASFFSFYDVTEKVGLIIGLLSFGFIEGAFGNMRTSILALIFFSCWVAFCCSG